MKKRNRRILTSVICLLMLCTMALPVSAATVEWTDADGIYNVATVNKTSNWYYYYKPIVDATIARHTSGTQSLITWPAGNNASYMVVIRAGAYTDKVDLALAKEGLTKQVVGAALTNDEGYYVIPAGVPSGTYSYGYEIIVYDISWRVDLDAPQPGGIAYAATSGDLSGTATAVPASITAAKLIPAE